MPIPPIDPKYLVKGASPHHHGSHRGLLSRPDKIPQAPSAVDAIVVPTARPSAYLQMTVELAAQLNCTIVALCSKRSVPKQAVYRSWIAEADVIAIDIPAAPANLLPDFTTTRLLSGTPFERRSDISFKRNLGLLLAHLTGWERIVFLDDDIAVRRPDDLGDAAVLLDSYSGVGLSIGGFPDNSVVCHAYREAGGAQDTFIGGGALAVRTSSIPSFFPNIYNEDWFFLLDDTRLRPSAMTGTAEQSPYDPFADTQRARSEEFGDTLAEGVYWLLDHGRRVKDADAGYWRGFLDRRRRFIGEVIAMVERTGKDPATKARMVASLKAARGRSLLISAELCEAYLRAWRADRVRWRRFVESFDGVARFDPEKVLSDLGLMGCAKYSYQRTRSAS